MKQVTITALIPDWADPETVADDTCDYLDMCDYLAAGAIVDITVLSAAEAFEKFEYEADDAEEDACGHTHEEVSH